MRNLFLIAKREYLATVRTKAFLIGLLVAPILMGGSIIAMGLFHDKVDTNDREVAIIDHTDQIAESIMDAAEERNAEKIHDDKGNKTKPAYLFFKVDSSQQSIEELRLELSNQVRNRELYGFLEIGEKILETKPESLEKEEESFFKSAFYSKSGAIDDIRNWMRSTLNQSIQRLHMTELGIPEAEADRLFHWHQVDSMDLVEEDEAGNIQDSKKTNEIATVMAPIGIVMVMFMLLMMGAMPLLNSVMEEKNQHIAETLLCSVTPFQFMFGKVLGGVAVSLTGSAFYLFGAVFTLANLGLGGIVPPEIIPWFIINLILANIMMGSIMSAIGSACTDAKESQNLAVPAMLPIMIPMFVLGPVIKEPLSGFATVLSLIPPFTPMIMLLRQGSPADIPAWQPIVGLVGLILFTLFSIWFASRIFRVAILIKGKTPNLGTMIKWAVKG